jgi:hypothetical protein
MDHATDRHHAVLGLSIVLAASVFGMFFYSSRTTESSIRVVGAATKRFESDMVKLRMSLNRIVSPDGLAGGYRDISRDRSVLLRELHTMGIADSEITVQPAGSFQNYGREGNLTGYTVQQSVFVASSNVDSIEAIAMNPASLMSRGLVIQSMNLEYFSTRLNEMKRELLAEATMDARRRAEEIAGVSGRNIEEMTSARAGVFQITEPYSTEVTDYGIFSTATRKKDITVTVNATFRMD